jgi:hypothetical protein
MKLSRPHGASPECMVENPDVQIKIPLRNLRQSTASSERDYHQLPETGMSIILFNLTGTVPLPGKIINQPLSYFFMVRTCQK